MIPSNDRQWAKIHLQLQQWTVFCSLHSHNDFSISRNQVFNWYISHFSIFNLFFKTKQNNFTFSPHSVSFALCKYSDLTIGGNLKPIIENDYDEGMMDIIVSFIWYGNCEHVQKWMWICCCWWFFVGIQIRIGKQSETISFHSLLKWSTQHVWMRCVHAISYALPYLHITMAGITLCEISPNFLCHQK